MRVIVCALGLLLVSAAVGPASAQNYPWCAQYGSGFGGNGGRNCGFSTFQQCMATVSGIGGFCEQNLLYRPSSAKKRSRKKK
jgi:hypothetical protein